MPLVTKNSKEDLEKFKKRQNLIEETKTENITVQNQLGNYFHQLTKSFWHQWKVAHITLLF